MNKELTPEVLEEMDQYYHEEAKAELNKELYSISKAVLKHKLGHCKLSVAEMIEIYNLARLDDIDNIARIYKVTAEDIITVIGAYE